MDKVPTAKEIVNKWALDDGDLLHDAAIEAVKEYAQLHVDAALKAACKSIRVGIEIDDSLSELKVRKTIDHNSILNAYPKTLIQ